MSAKRNALYTDIGNDAVERPTFKRHLIKSVMGNTYYLKELKIESDLGEETQISKFLKKP